jgi:hypothetical protein
MILGRRGRGEGRGGDIGQKRGKGDDTGRGREKREMI